MHFWYVFSNQEYENQKTGKSFSVGLDILL